MLFWNLLLAVIFDAFFRALEELDGLDFQGRLLHIEQGKEKNPSDKQEYEKVKTLQNSQIASSIPFGIQEFWYSFLHCTAAPRRILVTEALSRAGLESSNLIVGIDFTRSNEWTGIFLLPISLSLILATEMGWSLEVISAVKHPLETVISAILASCPILSLVCLLKPADVSPAGLLS
ncbi:unnamed protein product [Fraxinus pennsylvanica]|uniref:Uncharacterized protein n=1 Tax=Fraxinus pennsylvanica TaxID=56036 RepID=A0AAD2EB31_9LAMI|nr:unnamed protein product [Fraxinus pennsylvanica]